VFPAVMLLSTISAGAIGAGIASAVQLGNVIPGGALGSDL
jgi:hypothetical protein